MHKALNYLQEFQTSFNSNVDIYNQELEEIVDLVKGGLITIHQDGLKGNWQNLLCDGVHLYDWAVPSYTKNIKSGILKCVKAAKRIRNPDFAI